MDAPLYQLLTDGATVLTASRHLSHALRNEYAHRAQANGLSVWSTPRILPWSAYLRLACQQQRSNQLQAPRLLSEMQTLALWERIVAGSDIGRDLLNPAQAARNAHRSWQRMHQYQIPLRKVAAYPGDEAQAFVIWAQHFAAELQNKHWLDSAGFAEYLHERNFQPDGNVVMYGFDQLTPDMQRLLSAWQTRGVRVHQSTPVSRQAQAMVLAAKDSHAELRAAASWARQQRESGKQRIAVVAPRLTAQAAQVQRRFTEVFSPGDRRIDQQHSASAFRIVATPMLSSYALVHHALLMLQLLPGRADVLLVGQLLRSPFMAGYAAESSQRALADIKARDERREHWTCNELERLAATTQCLQLAASMQATANYLREHQGSSLPSQWTERFTQLLKLSGWSRGRTLDSTEQQTLHKWQQVLAELSALDELTGKISLTGAIRMLRDACNAESFAPESIEQAVTIIDMDSVAGMQFDALWVMGLHAGDWPPPPEPDPFLPIELQRQYGIAEASAERCLQLARQKLHRLVAAADCVVLSWPQHDEDAELRPSPLLAAWPNTTVADLPQAGIRSLGEQLFMHRPALDNFTDSHAPLLAPGAASGGTRILELQSRCPFRAQAELRLHADAMPGVSPAVAATERGTLVHRVLTELWQQLKDSEGLKALSDLQQTVHRIAERVAQQVIPAATRHRQRLAALEVELCTQWIMALLRVEAQRLPFRVQRAEQTESYELSGMRINIQLDRIDELADGGMLLIDYKTGDSNNSNDWLDRTSGRPRSPQLPLYALAHRHKLAGITFAVLAPGMAEFRGLADTDSIAPGIADYAQLKPARKLPSIDTWDELLEHWHTVLNGLAQQYLSGAAYVDPLKNECTYCHLHSLCRVHELLEAVDADDDEEGGDA